MNIFQETHHKGAHHQKALFTHHAPWQLAQLLLGGPLRGDSFFKELFLQVFAKLLSLILL